MIRKFFNWLNKKTVTEETINRRLMELIDDIKKYKLKCNNCKSFKEGCKNQDFEAMENIFYELGKINKLNYGTILNKALLQNPNLTLAEIFLIHGKSMFPSINEGDLLIISDFEQAKIGDIILCITETNSESLTVHRLIGKDDNFWYVKGDNNGEMIEKVHPNTIVGKINAIIKKEVQPEIYNFLYEKIARREYGGEKSGMRNSY